MAEELVPGCLPPPDTHPEISVIEYGNNFVNEVLKNCVGENMTRHNAVKYAALLIGTASGFLVPPVGSAAGAYMISELQSDVAKCLLKSFVTASSNMTQEQKSDLTARIDLTFQLKDWAGFKSALCGQVPELGDPENVRKIKTILNSVANYYDRQPEAVEALDWSTGISWSISSLFNDELQELKKRAAAALDDCRYQEASMLLKAVEGKAEKQCRELGRQYRIAERRYRNYCISHHRILQRIQQFYMDDDRSVLLRVRELEREYDQKGDRLKDHLKIYPELKGLRKRLEQERTALRKLQEQYLQTLEGIASLSPVTRACGKMSALREIVSRADDRCRKRFFSSSPLLGKRMRQLENMLSQDARNRSHRWWAHFDKIKALADDCKPAEAKAAAKRLRDDLEKHPSYRLQNLSCLKIRQDVLVQKLDQLAGAKYRGANCNPVKKRVCRSRDGRHELCRKHNCHIPPTTKWVCRSRDGRHELCRKNNCNIPPKRKRVCWSKDGRHGLCRKNGCNPVFTNKDGSTYTVPCYWEEVVYSGVPCYWEKVVSKGVPCYWEEIESQ